MPEPINIRFKHEFFERFLWTASLQTWIAQNPKSIEKLNHKNRLFGKLEAAKRVGCPS